MPLFEVTILEKPTKKAAANGKLERIVLAPHPVISTDEQTAAFSVVMDAKDLKFDKSRMDVLVRPFA